MTPTDLRPTYTMDFTTVEVYTWKYPNDERLCIYYYPRPRVLYVEYQETAAEARWFITRRTWRQAFPIIHNDTEHTLEATGADIYREMTARADSLEFHHTFPSELPLTRNAALGIIKHVYNLQ